MSDIRDSDSIPSERDMSVAQQIFSSDSGEFDVKKLAPQVARLMRKTTDSKVDMNKVLVCLLGDEMGQNPGVIETQRVQGDMITEIHSIVKEGVTTKQHKALSKDVEQAKGAWSAVKEMGGLLAWIITTIIAIIAIIVAL